METSSSTFIHCISHHLTITTKYRNHKLYYIYASGGDPVGSWTPLGVLTPSVFDRGPKA